ncbi:MAG: hypothetical protein JJ900_00235 [Rhodospirillales bacterium]|nr:hypothetical protein [Rhodospirillales bacterium]MBO6785243.1 hypothetical protein [Rhodospirillales bacterium]
MEQRTEFLKHLRNTHFVLVVTSIVIIVGLTGSQRIFAKAQTQLDAIINAEDAFRSDNLIKRIRNQAGGLTTTDGTAVKDFAAFLDDAVSAAWRRMEEESAQFPALELGYIDTYADFLLGAEPERYRYVYDEDLLDYTGLFHPQGTILESKGKFSYFLFDDGYRSSTLQDVKAGFDNLLAVERMYVQPTSFEYHTAMAVDEAIMNELANINADGDNVTLRLSAELKGLELTTPLHRDKHKHNMLAAQEDPYFLHDETLKPDMIVLDVTLDNTSDNAAVLFAEAPKTIEMRLPVFFNVVQPTFLEHLFREAFPNQPVASRYLAGGRSFAVLFPELAEVTQDLGSLNMENLTTYLRNQAGKGDAPITLLGVQLAQDLIEVWGILVLIGIQLYFCLHLSTYARLYSQGEEPSVFPWIGAYRDIVSRTIFSLSLALPVGVTGFLAYTQIATADSVKSLTAIYIVIEIVLFLFTAAAARKIASPKKQNTAPASPQ